MNLQLKNEVNVLFEQVQYWSGMGLFDQLLDKEKYIDEFPRMGIGRYLFNIASSDEEILDSELAIINHYLDWSMTKEKMIEYLYPNDYVNELFVPRFVRALVRLLKEHIVVDELEKRTKQLLGRYLMVLYRLAMEVVMADGRKDLQETKIMNDFGEHIFNYIDKQIGYEVLDDIAANNYVDIEEKQQHWFNVQYRQVDCMKGLAADSVREVKNAMTKVLIAFRRYERKLTTKPVHLQFLLDGYFVGKDQIANQLADVIATMKEEQAGNFIMATGEKLMSHFDNFLSHSDGGVIYVKNADCLINEEAGIQTLVRLQAYCSREDCSSDFILDTKYPNLFQKYFSEQSRIDIKLQNE